MEGETKELAWRQEVKKYFHSLFDIRGDMMGYEELDEMMRENTVIYGSNMWILILAILIASIGLNMNSTAVIIGGIKKLKELKIFAEELTAEITSIEDELKAEMTAQNVEELTVDIFKIRYKTVTSNRFDSKAFQTANPELYNQYTKPTAYRRFTVN